MKLLKRLLVIGALFSGSAPLQADVAVLVHGYLGSASSWESSGVNAVLVANGWKRAGVLRTDPTGLS